MNKEFVLDILLEKALDLDGPFQFAHLPGKSPMRMNIDKILASPGYSKRIALYLSLLLNENPRRLSAIGGIETGGMPWASRMADFWEIPEFYIKKDGSIHGTDERNLGGNLGIVEDVVTTGKTLDLASEGLKREGRNLKTVAIFNYGFREDISALVYLEDILEKIPGDKREIILNWYESVRFLKQD